MSTVKLFRSKITIAILLIALVASVVGVSLSASAAGTGPCDIYAAGGTPCVAAHSTVRALYGAYNGRLYQVRRASNGNTLDINTLSAGGFANTAAQDSFCSGTTCTISILYDQSPQHNDLRKAPAGATWLPNGGNESSATKGKATVAGHTVYGIYVTGFSDNVAYRNNSTTGIARGNEAESMYMVVDGRRFSSACCFDYGNAETNSKDNGNGTMEALYFGTDTAWGGQGDGNGPWIAADLENGMFKGNAGCYNCYPGPWPSAKSLAYNFVTAILKGPDANTFTLKGGNAQSGTLTTMWNSSRPSPNYYPKKLEGAIILGTGGDGSNGGTGTFYEGAMTIGNPSDAIDDAIQANIVAAGYGNSIPGPTNTPPGPTATPGTGPISINVGGSATGSFTADQYYSGGTTYTNTNTIDVSQVGSVPAAVFQSERYGAFTYTIPNRTAGTAQTVTLYFAETYLTAAGQRLFSVSINGTTVLSSFDIYASAGGQNKAIARTFNTTANSSGQVVIQFTTGTENPKINGITVNGGVGPTNTPGPTPTKTNTPTTGPTNTTG